MGDGDKDLEVWLDEMSDSYDSNTGTIDTGIDYTPNYSWAFPQQDNIEVPESGDVKIGDRSLKEFMDKVESRLAILTPDSKKLEKFAALRKAYEHYKTLESLCELEEEDDHDGSIDY